MNKKKKLMVLTLLIISPLFFYLSLIVPKIVEVKPRANEFPNSSFPKLNFDIKVNSFFLPFFDEIKENLLTSRTDFLEVNLEEMKVRAYRAGILKKEVPILTKGDPRGWGGTAAGLYQVKSKYRNSFSVVSKVYMPWAIHFYGKYYLHGQPYYPGGKHLISSVSGGCLRLNDQDAKSIYQLAVTGTPILVIDKSKDGYKYSEKTITRFPEVSAKSYLVADLDSGFVLAEKDSQISLPIASLTKLMTAVVVAENIDLSKFILVREEMLEAYGSTEGLVAGETFNVVELFYPLLIESSNDAAEVLAGFLGREKTIRLMNEKAKSILMEQATFVGPSGYNPENKASARDLFYLGRYILNNRPPILEITKSKKVRTFGKISFELDNLWNKNIFVHDPDFIGGKTGYIKTSKYTALFIFRFSDEDGNERRLAIILLGSDNLEVDAQKIYQWLQKNYFQD